MAQEGVTRLRNKEDKRFPSESAWWFFCRHMVHTDMINEIIPKWTKRVFTDMGGRDPLGLSRVADAITDYLLPGIITTTDRARYYSFYCWTLWHIDKEDTPKKYQDFVDGFRRREAVAALATVVNNPETSPVGVRVVKAELEKCKEDDKINCNFKVLPSNQLGGYGQYYSGSLYQLGLTHRPEDGIDRVTEGKGEALAKTLHTIIEKTTYIKKRLFDEMAIPVNDLRELKKYLSLDAISQPFATEERKELIDLFFSISEHGPSERAILRRHTLSQILYIISEYQGNGFNVNMDELDWYLVYPTYYYDALWPDDNKAIPYNCPEAFKVCHQLWKQHCLQQFIAQAIESLLYSVLEVVGSESVGLTIEEIVSRLLLPEFFSILEDITGKPCKKPRELLSVIGSDSIPNERASWSMQKKISLLDPRSEIQVMDLENNTPQASAAKAILLLAVLYGKWRGISSDLGMGIIADNAGSELWAGNIVSYFDCWLSDSMSWHETFSYMIEAFVLDQHDRIMYEKRKLDSCWLHRRDNRVFKDQDYSPALRSSRHKNAVLIMSDLDLLSIDDDGDISLTSEGRKILRTVLR